jgi:hypothetical protein
VPETGHNGALNLERRHFSAPDFSAFFLSRGGAGAHYLEKRTESGINFRQNDFPVPDRDKFVLSFSILRPMMNKDAIDCRDVTDV